MFSPPNTNANLDLSRRKQINTLMIFNQNVSEVLPGVQYRVDFQIVASRENSQTAQVPVALHIFLPPGFPKERPNLRVLSNQNLSHPWLDQHGNVIGAPGLVNYTMLSDIGRLVQAVKRELELNLSVKSSPVSSTGSLSTASPTSTSSTSKPITNHSHVVPFPNNPPNFNGTQVGAFIHPNHAFNNHFNDAIGVKLKELSLEELKELHESDIELKQFYKEKLSDNPFKKKISHDVTQLKKDIHEVIKVSGDVQDDLIKAKEALETKKAEYLGLRNELGQLYTETHTRSEDMSRLGLSERLKSATMAEDENGERLSEQFLAGNLNCSEFLDSYIGSRALHHARKVKYDKMKKSKKVSKPRPGYSYIP